MTLNEIFNLLNIKSSIQDTVIKSVKTDSRKIKKGDIFIALKGEKYDGNSYALEAIKKGALISIVDKDLNNERCIKVQDTYEVLFKIGNYIRNKYKIPLIAVTGSNGKTTTKDLITHILKSKYNVLYNEESKNNIIGVSDTLFRLNNNYDIIVMELGSNHIGEISLLSRMCNPDISVITNIGSSHLQYFKTRKNIFKEKSSIAHGMKEKKLVVNGDDKYLMHLDSFKCGLSDNNDLKAYDICETANSTTFSINLDKEYKVVFNNPGKHFVIDVLLAIQVCLNYLSIKEIIKRVSTFKLTNKRMNIIKLKDNVLINDCYNSSLESITAGLNYLNNISGNKVAIIGDILELGKHSKRIHRRINKVLKDDIRVLTIGKFTKYLKGIHFNTIDELLVYLKNNQIRDSYIYVKGSRKIGLDRIVEYFEKR